MPPKTEHSRALTKESLITSPITKWSSCQVQVKIKDSIFPLFCPALHPCGIHCALLHTSQSLLHYIQLTSHCGSEMIHNGCGQEGCSPFHLLTLTSLQKTQGRGKSPSHPPLHLFSWLQLLQADHSPAFRALFFKSWWPWDKALRVDRGLGTCSPARHQSAEADSVWGRAGALPASWHINIQQPRLRVQEAEAQRIMSKHP